MSSCDSPIESRRRARRSSAETREHVLNVAGDLFYADGVHATGVDAVAARAEVAPTTLYRLFGSKDGLVTAYVVRCRERYHAVVQAACAPGAGTPRERILAVFDAFAAEIGSGSCRGCPFLMVLAEFPDPQSQVHAEAVAHKAWLRDLFHRLVGELSTTVDLADPETLADQLALVAEGMYGAVQAFGSAGPAMLGRAAAEALIEGAHLQSGRPTRRDASGVRER